MLMRQTPLLQSQPRAYHLTCRSHASSCSSPDSNTIAAQAAASCATPGFSRRELGALIGAASAAIAAGEDRAQAGLLSVFGGTPDAYPEAVRFPRSKLDQRFAVLLMRSVYDAVDSLDFIPMSEFQAKFWKLRQDEYERYLERYSPLRVRQGDLQDPLYFDFISFAQMATIDREIPNGRQVFEEFCESCADQKRVVRRSPSMKDNAQLPGHLQRAAGDAMFVGLRDGFRGEEFGGPVARPAGTHLAQLTQDVQRILDIFVDKGYAIKASLNGVSADCSEGSCEYHGANGSKGSFTVKLEGSATLWGLGALNERGSKLSTAFSAMTIEAYLRASGVQAAFSIARSPSTVTQRWSLG